MSLYDIDFEIVYTIKNGHHNFNEIWSKIKEIGSKQTFSKHLTQLVEAGFILKKIEQGKPRYHLGNDTTPFDTDKGLINKLNNEITTITEKSKKIPDKKLLNEFVQDTQDLLIVLSQLNFTRLTILDSYKKDKQQHIKPFIGLNEKKIELINKLITTRINILNERDPELFITFFALIQNNLNNFLSKK